VDQGICFPKIVQELVSEALSRRGSRHKTGTIDQFNRDKPLPIDATGLTRLILNPKSLADALRAEIRDPPIWSDSCKRIVCNRYDRQSGSAEEGAFSRVRFSYNSNLHLLPRENHVAE